MKTPMEIEIEEEIKTQEKATKMQAELNKYGRKTLCGGTVWTVSDLAKFFLDQKR